MFVLKALILALYIANVMAYNLRSSSSSSDSEMAYTIAFAQNEFGTQKLEWWQYVVGIPMIIAIMLALCCTKCGRVLIASVFGIFGCIFCMIWSADQNSSDNDEERRRQEEYRMYGLYEEDQRRRAEQA